VTVDLRLVGVGPFEDGQRTVAARFERRGVVVPSLYDFLTAHEITDRSVVRSNGTTNCKQNQSNVLI
jgi:hypothetical protein